MVDMTNLSNISSLQGLAYYTNNMVDGVLVTGGVIVLFFVMVMVLLKNDDVALVNVLAVSGWSMFVLSAMTWMAQLTPTLLSLGFLLVAGVCTLVMYSSSRY